MDNTEQEELAMIAGLLRDIYRGFIETGADISKATVDADCRKALEFTRIPLEVWQHIGVDGQALIAGVQASRAAKEGVN